MSEIKKPEYGKTEYGEPEILWVRRIENAHFCPVTQSSATAGRNYYIAAGDEDYLIHG